MANHEHERILRDALRNGQLAVDLRGFDLTGLRFSSIRLEAVNLSGSDLCGADLSGGYFRGCNLRNVRFNKARISLGDFRDADLSEADLTAADFNGSTLTDVNLQGANLTRANFVRTRLGGANLAQANLDRCDFRGVQGLTAEQLASAVNSGKAILDERMLALMHRDGDLTTARHGARKKKSAAPSQVDLLFLTPKPSFGDVFLICGEQHPKFPPTGSFGFNELSDLGIEQVDDYFAICAEGEPVVWIFPLVKGQAVAHHQGPYDGIRIELGDRSYKRLWTKCVTRFRETLQLAPPP